MQTMYKALKIDDGVDVGIVNNCACAMVKCCSQKVNGGGAQHSNNNLIVTIYSKFKRMC